MIYPQSPQCPLCGRSLGDMPGKVCVECLLEIREEDLEEAERE
jgi:tRNA(Ile2) C34 agmatinyltransferase TiaS